ncbi:MAG: ComEC/Rec2 family competence protein [Acetatifactor sp.]|nr:ComEC/Rec2 family competence protein [Acetatifactor sp.]
MACLCLVIVITIMKILTGAGTGGDAVLPPDGSPVRITGRIDTRISEVIILQCISLIHEDQTYSYSGKLQCELDNMKTAMITAGAVTGEEESLKIGQQIILEGTFSHFATATNPGEFDVQRYYAAKGIGGRVRKSQILAVGEKYSFLREKLYGFRQVLHDRLAEVFPAKEASVMQTLLLGEKEELDAEVKALYQKNGIAHILSISGLHITLLGMGVYRLLKRLGLPVRAAAVGGAMLLLIYGVMVGMSVSASRAIGMYLLQMLGIFVGRTYDMLTGLGLMALLLVLQEPERLCDVSFLMSFGAVLGICILTPVLSGDGRERDADAELEVKGISAWLRTVADILGDSAYERNKYREGWRKVAYEGIQRIVSAVKGDFAASVGVILFTLPVQLWFFYEIPVYSVLLNLLVLPFMSVVVAGGILSLIPGLGLVGTVDCLILWWYEWICGRFAQLPGAIWCVGRPEIWQIVCYYVGIFLLVFGREYVEAWKKRGTYGEKNVPGDRQHFARTLWCLKMRGAWKRRGTYGEKNVPGDRQHFARTLWCLITRGADESIRNRKKDCNGEMIQHSDRRFGICPTGVQNALAKFRCAWQGAMTYMNRVPHLIAVVMILGLLIGLLTGNFDCGSRVIFLDVGQGDGIVVETGQGAYLFDCGSTSRKNIGEYVLKPYLKSRGIRSLRGVFVSHPDEDHMNGVIELLENGADWGIVVEQLFLPAIAEGKRTESFATLLAAAEVAEVPVSYIKCGDEIRDSQLRLLCLHPEENTTLADANAYSECFYVEVFAKKMKQEAIDDRKANDASGGSAMEGSGENGNFAGNGSFAGNGERKDFRMNDGKINILLTGDVEGEGERQLTQELQEQRGQREFRVDILKVAHHGSGYSTGTEFLATASPAIAIISCGRNNSYGHPHAETLQRLEDARVPWYGTMDYGALTVTVDSHGNRLRGYLSGK